MKRFFRKQPPVLLLYVLLNTLFYNHPIYAGSVGSVSVMDPDEAGDQAMISRFKAEVETIKANEDGSKTTDEGVYYEDGIMQTGGDCNMAIGNVKTEVGASAPSSNIVIIDGPVIQECN